MLMHHIPLKQKGDQAIEKLETRTVQYLEYTIDRQIVQTHHDCQFLLLRKVRRQHCLFTLSNDVSQEILFVLIQFFQFRLFLIFLRDYPVNAWSDYQTQFIRQKEFPQRTTFIRVSNDESHFLDETEPLLHLRFQSRIRSQFHYFLEFLQISK